MIETTKNSNLDQNERGSYITSVEKGLVTSLPEKLKTMWEHAIATVPGAGVWSLQHAMKRDSGLFHQQVVSF